MTALLSFILSVVAGVAADVIGHLICKWLDRDEHSDNQP